MDPETVITNEEDLLEYFHLGARPRERFGIGVEYERLGVFRETGRAIPYEGDASVETILRTLATRGWTPRDESGQIMSLARGTTHVTLEPGGQMELSGSVHRTLEGAQRELDDFVTEVEEISRPLGIAWLGIGSHPISPLAEISWIPKRRYAIMRDYLPTRGSLAHTMMKGTACIQVNIDYADEADAAEKLRISMGLSPLVTALFANSPLTEGHRNGFQSYRSWVWRDTDPDRCGLLPFVFREDAGFSDYLQYALGVPMFFVVRDGRWIAGGRTTFRTFIRDGFEGAHATYADFELHITTLFPEVRLKQYIEMRGCDSGTPESCIALAALWKGLLYDDTSRTASWALVRDMTFQERDDLLARICRDGMAANLAGSRRGAGKRDVGVRDLLIEVLQLARDGLKRQEVAGEAAYLDPLDRRIEEEGGSPAVRLADAWEGVLGRDPGALISALAGNGTIPT
ncbi:MAG: glutamate-cysteine ligase family protein [Acidobacteria bacterium]|nr:glutamate-cysteine ligase family protein [Acidobacteriota bacterium]